MSEMDRAERGRLAGKHVALDARMVNSSGIGRYTRAVIEVLSSAHTHLTALSFPVPPYHPFEQIALPFAVPPCDLYFSPHITTTFLPVRARRRVVTVHDAFHLGSIADLGPARRAYAEFLYRNALGTADAVIAVSEFTRGEIARLFPAYAHKITVVPNALDHRLFFSDPSPAETEQAGILGPYVLFVGNLKPHKNLVTAARAVELQPDPDLRLVVAGSGTGFISRMGPELQELQNNPRITFLGVRDDAMLRHLYSGAECLVFPSLYEGFGYPPLEAMACGTPAICSDIPSLRETCAEAAIYSNPASAEAFAQSIHSLRSRQDLRGGLVSEGRDRAAHFSMDRFASATLEVLAGAMQ